MPNIYQLSALIMLLAFYAIYYGKLFIQKKQGITTFQLKKQQSGREKTVGSLMGIATLILPLGELLSLIFNISALPDWARTAGIFIVLTGNIIFLISVCTMGRSWRAGVSRDEKTELISSGIYSISRNPAFLGFDLAYTGLLMMFFSWWLLALTLFAVVMLHLQIVMVEEPFLPEAFGEEYSEYKSRVCRYLGRKRA